MHVFFIHIRASLIRIDAVLVHLMNEQHEKVLQFIEAWHIVSVLDLSIYLGG
jgi:hypothetical protein